MATNITPFVSIVGGFGHLQGARLDQAKNFARQIGGELATAGFGIVVYNSEGWSLEPHVVSGYVAATANGTTKRLIRVRCAQSQRDAVVFAEESNRTELFDRQYFPSQDWEAPFYRSLVDAEGVDGAVLMAGARSTLVAGQIAVARGLPLLAFEHFDGSAAVIWSELAAKIPGYPSSANPPGTAVAWLRKQCDAQAISREQVRRREAAHLKKRSQLEKTFWAMGAFVALLAAVLFGLARSPRPDYYMWITLGGLVAGGATGALIRSVIWSKEESGPMTSLLLGSVAGFIVGLAYLIPQWIGAPGVLDTANTAVGATDKIQFVSALLVAISAGVGFDTVFTRLKKDAETHAVGPAGVSKD